MPKIRILPNNIVNLIAAGEVVDRPSSVVKELIENSIDAGANQIAIEIKGDGRELIRVTDNGIGMTEEDALLAFERHATSKIASADDLDCIKTMGFRGEALPSIASVSEVEMITRSAEDEVATRLVVIGGKVTTVEKTSRTVGTTVRVKNLFFNAPARAKFLKSRATEMRHVTRVVATHALSHYWIGMRLMRDRRIILSLPPVETIEERIGGILGGGFTENAIVLNVADEQIRVYGFLSRPEDARSSSGFLSIFVNARPVESRPILRSICAAYGTMLPANRYPTGVVMIDIDPREIDANVHPTKRQIRFRREKEVGDFIHRAVASALASRKMIPPLVRPARPQPGKPKPTEPPPLLGKKPILVAETRKTYSPDSSRVGQVQPIAQIKDAYILAQSEADFYLIDQHAAHERVLYEQAYRSLETGQPDAQKLLFPHQIEVTPEEEEVIDEHLERITRMGFELRKFGKRTYVVEAVPAHLKESQHRTILRDMIDEAIEIRSRTSDVNHMLAAAFACKAALKAGDRMSDQEIRALLDQLFSSRMPFSCPHGRPTMIRLSWEEIERRFMRR